MARLGQSKRPVALTAGRFSDRVWSPPRVHKFGGNLRSVAIGAAEAGKLASALPLYFRKRGQVWEMFAPLRDPKTGHPLWLGPDQRLSVSHVPFLLRMYPFTMISDETGQRLAVWEDDECFEDGKFAFFEDGKLSDVVAAVQGHFAKFAQDLKNMDQLVSDLHSAGVLSCVNPDMPELAQMWRVDEEALSGLRGEDLNKVHARGALGLGYAQMLSQHNRYGIAETGTKGRADAAPAPQQDAFLSSILDDMDDGALDETLSEGLL